MSDMPSLSIVTPTFNASRYLQQTIDSVAMQNYRKVQHLIVDGGSGDGTLDIIRANEGTITRWVSEPDEGLSDAFNKGIKMADGQIIGIINADDYYHPGALAAVAQAAREYPDCDVYYGDAIHERFDGSSEFLFRPDKEIGRRIWHRMPVSHPATFVRRSAYERFGLFSTRYRLAMDYELMLRMFRNGARFCYVNAVLSHFRYGQDRGIHGLREVRDCAVSNGRSPFLANWDYYLARLKMRVKTLRPLPAQNSL
jgi:glycosyltransferase involved in cell wall biosynthesis